MDDETPTVAGGFQPDWAPPPPPSGGSTVSGPEADESRTVAGGLPPEPGLGPSFHEAKTAAGDVASTSSGRPGGRPGSGPLTHVGPYEVVRELGRGGMGVVYEVRHPGLPERALALKLMLDVEKGDGLARFAREAEVMARVRHRGVVAVHQLGQLPEGPFLVTDFVAGQGLDRVQRDTPFAPRRAAEVLRELADALAAVHAAGVLHRDLKPANVILRASDGSPVLLDFGIARDDRAQRLTATGDLLGTPVYMAPEQADAGTTVDARADVYGLGAILFELLTRRAPYVGPSPHAILRELLVGDGPRWPAPEPGAERPWALEAICRMAMEREPRRRYRSAEALRDDLDLFLRGAPPKALERFPAPRGRSALGLGLGLAGLAVVCAAGGWLALRPSPGPPTVDVAPTSSRGLRPPPPASRPSPPRPLSTQPDLHLEHVTATGGRHLVQACFLDDAHVLTVGKEKARAWRLDGERSAVLVGKELTLPGTGTLSRDLARLPGGGALFASEKGKVEERRACLGELAIEDSTLVFRPWRPEGLEALHGCAAALGTSALVAFRLPTPPEAQWRSVVARVDASGGREDLFEVPHLANRLVVDGQLVAAASGQAGTDVERGAVARADLGALRVHDLTDPTRVVAQADFHSNVHCVAFTTVDGRRQVAVGLANGELLLVEVDGDPTLEPRGLSRPGVQHSSGISKDLAHHYSVRDLLFDPRRRRLWSVSGERTGALAVRRGELCAWSVEGASPGARLTRPADASGDGLLRDLGDLDLSPDGRLLLTGDDGGGAGVWLLPD